MSSRTTGQPILIRSGPGDASFTADNGSAQILLTFFGADVKRRQSEIVAAVRHAADDFFKDEEKHKRGDCLVAVVNAANLAVRSARPIGSNQGASIVMAHIEERKDGVCKLRYVALGDCRVWRVTKVGAIPEGTHRRSYLGEFGIDTDYLVSRFAGTMTVDVAQHEALVLAPTHYDSSQVVPVPPRSVLKTTLFWGAILGLAVLVVVAGWPVLNADSRSSLGDSQTATAVALAQSAGSATAKASTATATAVSGRQTATAIEAAVATAEQRAGATTATAIALAVGTRTAEARIDQTVEAEFRAAATAGAVARVNAAATRAAILTATAEAIRVAQATAAGRATASARQTELAQVPPTPTLTATPRGTPTPVLLIVSEPLTGTSLAATPVQGAFTLIQPDGPIVAGGNTAPKFGWSWSGEFQSDWAFLVGTIGADGAFRGLYDVRDPAVKVQQLANGEFSAQIPVPVDRIGDVGWAVELYRRDENGNLSIRVLRSSQKRIAIVGPKEKEERTTGGLDCIGCGGSNQN